MISKAISKLILKILGWKVEAEIPELDKCVVVGAPHTSNTDFYLSMLFFLSRGMKISFIIKKEALFFPVAGLVKKLGGIPVDRSKRNNLIEELAIQFKAADKLLLMISPEGTRKKVSHWKRGFYYIAKEAQVPIVLAYIDYKHKTLGVGPVFMPSDDVESDLLKTKQFYKNINPKYPEMFSVGDA